MSLERLVDDLARTLARPMPRRTALQLLGGSLVAAATPAVAPGRALAALTSAPPCNPNVETCCEEDRRVCHKDAPVLQNKGYCCPRPSWRWQCGSKANGYKCIDICPENARQFPCTATIPNRESGYNGLCCDRRYSVGCNADGTCRSCASDEQICSPYKRGQSRCCDLRAGERCFANETSTACCGKDQVPVIKPGKPAAASASAAPVRRAARTAARGVSAAAAESSAAVRARSAAADAAARAAGPAAASSSAATAASGASTR